MTPHIQGTQCIQRTRTNDSATFTAKVVLTAVGGARALVELAEQYKVPASQISQWRVQLFERAADVFPPAAEWHEPVPDLETPHTKIGRLTFANENSACALGRIGGASVKR